jgi:hypothetical protein
MTHLIQHYADILNFGYHDLMHPKMYLVKKYLIIKRIAQDHPITKIADAFGYSHAQACYNAITKVDGWIKVDKDVREMWEGLR